MKALMNQLRESAVKAILNADSPENLEALRVKYLGKRASLPPYLSRWASSAEERPVMGQLANQIRAELESAIDETRKKLEAAALEARLELETVDVTVPGEDIRLGHKHPMYKALDEIKEIFVGMGFTVLDGPEVELATYNFDKLNAEEGHPSRDWSDTFYFDKDSRVMLRSQTSPMQVRAMETMKLPIRIVAPGRVYRKDEVDATHSPMFHQIEGMVIDKNVTMADLKGTLNLVMQELFGEGTVTRFRPHHFPFTEPSCEMDVQCHKCGGKGCPTCKGEGWIEVLGAGMIHPKVLEMSGIDSEEYTGWAFGMGLERLAMRRFKISDLRLIFENDVRFWNSSDGRRNDMNLSRKWLTEFVDGVSVSDIDDREFSEAMTLSGSKVETYEDLGAEINNVLVGKILSMEKHPDSDHMWVCLIDVGQEEPVQIVTGAWNIHTGDLVPAALHNSLLPGGKKITKGKLRGVLSNGMLCSLKELDLDERDFPTAL